MKTHCKSCYAPIWVRTICLNCKTDHFFNGDFKERKPTVRCCPFCETIIKKSSKRDQYIERCSECDKWFFGKKMLLGLTGKKALFTYPMPDIDTPIIIVNGNARNWGFAREDFSFTQYDFSNGQIWNYFSSITECRYIEVKTFDDIIPKEYKIWIPK